MTEIDHSPIDRTDLVLVANLERILAEVAAVRGSDQLTGYTPWAFTNRVDRREVDGE